jgi:hypothetical protein
VRIEESSKKKSILQGLLSKQITMPLKHHIQVNIPAQPLNVGEGMAKHGMPLF